MLKKVKKPKNNGQFRCVFPFDEELGHKMEDHYLPSYAEALKYCKDYGYPCVLYSPNGIPIGIVVKGRFIGIH
jgi:hypothetical protein